MRQAILIAVVLVLGAALAHWHVTRQSYFPVIKVDLGGGVTLTAVQEAVRERSVCGQANDRFLEPLKKACSTCKIFIARCEGELAGLELDLVQRRPVPFHVVEASVVHMALDGPSEQRRAMCESIASDIRKLGVADAACIPPRSPGKS